MVKKWLGAVAGLVTSAGFVLAQAPAPASWTPNLSPYAEMPAAIQAVRYQPEASAPASSPTLQPVPANSYSANRSEGELGDPGFWFQSEYLLWTLKTAHTPSQILFGTIPASLANTPDLPSGAITNISHENTRLDYHPQSGLRLGAGVWLDGAREWSVDGNWFQLEQGHRDFAGASSGAQVIGPVYEDPVTGRQTIILFAIPNARSAELESSTSNRLWGAEINLRREIAAVYFGDRLDLLVGFRHLQFNEGLELSGTHTALPGFVDPVARITSYTDQFGVDNKFDGAQIGLASHADVGPFTVDLTGKVAFGGMQELAKINGSTTLVDPLGAIGTTITRPGGVLTQPTNMGSFKRNEFAIVPEFTLNLGWRITSWMQATVGYNFLYVNNLYRVGNQLDGVDGRQIFGSTAFVPNAQPAPTRPLAPGDASSVFWAQGITVGLEFSY